jgi:predicted MFS family arabinose efflux permease
MALALVFVVTASSFLLNPNLSAFVQHNLGFPREHLAGLYAVAGAVALVTTQLTGWAVDRFGALRVGALAASVFCAVVLGVVVAEGALDVRLGFIVLLASLQARNVSVRALATRVPPPQERGRFMSLWSAAQQLGAAAGALVSAVMLSADPSGRLIGLPRVGLFSVLLTLGALPRLAAVHRSVVGRFEREGSRPLA